MSENEKNEFQEEIIENEKPKKKFRINIHMILITIIVVILGVSAYKLIAWNKGETIKIDPNEDTSEFDVEVLDEILPLSSTGAEGHTYDDETTILILGDGDIAFSRDDENGLADKIATATNATVYNGAFPYVTLSTQNLAMIEQNYPDDIYSLSYIADAICTGDFSEIDRVTSTYHQDGNFTQDAVKQLKAVDYDNLDVIVIAYDAQDYFKGRSIENPNDDEERCTYVGSLKYAVRQIQKTYPYVRIVVSSLYYAPGTNPDGNTYDPDIENHGNGTISNYVYSQLQTCADLSITFVDNFYGTINQNNYTQYLDLEAGVDYIKLNDAGEQVLADRIAYAINKFPNDK